MIVISFFLYILNLFACFRIWCAFYKCNARINFKVSRFIHFMRFSQNKKDHYHCLRPVCVNMLLRSNVFNIFHMFVNLIYSATAFVSRQLRAHNCQKRKKTRFFTCPCHKLYRVELVYIFPIILLKLRSFEFVKFGTVSWKTGYFVNNRVIEVRI